jgi:hypothetical protein
VFTCAFLLHASMREGTDMPFKQVGSSDAADDGRQQRR